MSAELFSVFPFLRVKNRRQGRRFGRGERLPFSQQPLQILILISD